jgi:PPE-repeat protein
MGGVLLTRFPPEIQQGRMFAGPGPGEFDYLSSIVTYAQGLDGTEVIT